MDQIFLTLLSLAVGGAIGYLTCRHFYKKSEVFEIDMRNLGESLEQIFMNAKYPNLFQTPNAFVTNYPPERHADLDVPFLLEARCESNKIPRGSSLFVVFRVADEGRNLSLQNGIQVRTDLHPDPIRAIHEGFAWMSATIPIPFDSPIGIHTLHFTLQDNGGKTCKQNLEFQVTESTYWYVAEL